MKLSEDEQRCLGDLVDKLWRDLEQLATDEQDKLEWYIEEMQKRQEEEPPIVDKDGVLVVQSRAVGDIANAVRREWDARATELV